MADLEEKFQKAAEDIKKLLSRPTDQELLEVYGLFKQATVGDCNQAKPGIFQMKERAKYETWFARKGMSQEQAKQEYIKLVEKLVERIGVN